MNPVLKRTVTALTIAAALVCAILFLPVAVIPWALGVFGILAAFEYIQLLRIKNPSAGVFAFMLVLGLAILAGAFWMLGWVALNGAELTGENVLFLYTIALVKISDMGGFAFGLGSMKLFGNNHKLCPSISPGKSWEGLFGSIVGSCVVAFAFSPYTRFPAWLSLALGLTAALVGTFGDLVESKFKRWVGVKDSSTLALTNGMGGILDMFDSLLFAPAAIWAVIGLAMG